MKSCLFVLESAIVVMKLAQGEVTATNSILASVTKGGQVKTAHSESAAHTRYTI